MSIIKTESIKQGGHLRNIITHMLPEEGTVGRTHSIAQLYAIAPNVDVSPQVTKINLSCKI